MGLSGSANVLKTGMLIQHVKTHKTGNARINITLSRVRATSVAVEEQ